MSLNEILQNIIYILITVLLPLVIRYVVLYMKNKTSEVENNIINDELFNIINRSETIVSNIVLSVSQTYVDSVKKSGKWDDESAKNAKNEAVEKANEMISEESKNIIDALYGSFENWLDIQIEKEVKENK